MKLSEAKKLGLTEQLLESAIDVNPLVLYERHYFDKKTFSFEKPQCYREQALDKVCTKQLPFATTANGVYEAIKRFVKISCPYCHNETEPVYGGGSTDSFTATFQCKSCGAKVHLSGNHDMLSATPGENK